jgi:hypothetical protein
MQPEIPTRCASSKTARPIACSRTSCLKQSYSQRSLASASAARSAPGSISGRSSMWQLGLNWVCCFHENSMASLWIFSEMMKCQTPFSMPRRSGCWGAQLRGCPPSFWGQSPNSPSLRLARRVRRFAPQRNWCLTPITRCVERPSSLGLQAGLVRNLRKPLTLLAEGGAVGGVAKSRRRPQAGGHSRSHPLRRPRPHTPGAQFLTCQSNLHQAGLTRTVS